MSIFAPAVRIASDSQVEAKNRALPYMRRAVGLATGLAALAGAPSVWYMNAGAVTDCRSGVAGDATAEGALDRLLDRCDVNRANGMDAATLADEFNDSAEEIRFWIAGAEETVAGPENAGILATIATSEVGSIAIAAGLTVDALVGIPPPPSTSGRDDVDIADAKTRADKLKLGLGIGLTVAVIAGAVGLYLYFK